MAKTFPETVPEPQGRAPEAQAAMLVLVALSVSHLLNDTIQSLLPCSIRCWNETMP